MSRESNTDSRSQDGEFYVPKKIIFFIELPEPLSITHGSIYRFETDDYFNAFDGIPMFPSDQLETDPIISSGKGYVSFRFWQRGIPYPSPFSPTLLDVMRSVLPESLHPRTDAHSSGKIEGIESQVTVVDAVTYLNDDDLDGSISDAYDRCVEKLADLVRAYQLATHKWMTPVTRERLPLVVPYIIAEHGEVAHWDPDGISLLFTHRNLPAPAVSEFLSQEEMGQLDNILVSLYKGDPMVAYLERIYHAQRRLNVDGDYMDAVLHAQIAAEVLLDNVLGMLLWEEQVAPEDAAPIFDTGLTKRVTSQFHPRLRGTWDPAKQGPVRDWERNVYRLRGRVVHGNYQPTLQETRQAMESIRTLQTFICDRLAASRNRYMRTAIRVVGVEGLTRRGAWTSKIMRFFESKAHTEPDWIESYVSWRKQVTQFFT